MPGIGRLPHLKDRDARTGRGLDIWGLRRGQAVFLVVLLVLAACSTNGDGSSGSSTTEAPATTSGDGAGVPPPGSTVPLPTVGDAARLTIEEKIVVLDEVVDFINTETPSDPDEAALVILEHLRGRPEFVDTGIDEADGSVWAQFADGVIYSHVNNRPLTGATEPTAQAPPASRQTQGVQAAFQLTPAGAQLPASTQVRVMSGLSDFYGPIPTAIKSGLTGAGYQVSAGEASVGGLKLEDSPALGVFYIRSHGGSGDIWTTTSVNTITAIRFAGDLLTGRIRPMSASVAEHEYELHWAITPSFMTHYWSDKLADNALVVLDACGSVQSSPVVAAMKASAVAAWEGSVSEIGSNRILTLFFDRLLGLNKVEPDETPDLRPFDAEAVGKYLLKTTLGVDVIHKDAMLDIHDDGPTALVPSIKLMEVDEPNDELVIEGLFGDTKGLVTINGEYPDIIDWKPGLIRVGIKDTTAGPVVVEQRLRKSNEVPLTEWRGTMSYNADAGPLGENLIFSADFDLHLRADVHLFREVPWQDPLPRKIEIVAAGDSTATWTASGTNSQQGATMTLSGSGEMKVEEQNADHSLALFKVSATLEAKSWTAPPQVTNAYLHAHLASDPKAKLKIETTVMTTTSGYPLPQTNALEKIPFELDMQFNILEGEKPSSGGMTIGNATLKWRQQTATFGPSMSKPPQAASRPPQRL